MSTGSLTKLERAILEQIRTCCKKADQIEDELRALGYHFKEDAFCEALDDLVRQGIIVLSHSYYRLAE